MDNSNGHCELYFKNNWTWI